MLKDLVALANHLDAKGLSGEADYLDKIVRASLDDAPSYFENSDLPLASKHKEPALYGIIANRAIGRGEGTVFFALQESVYNNLKAQKLLSDESDSPMGPFTAKDIEVIASVISDSLKKDFRSVIFPELDEDVKKMVGKELMSIPQEEWSRASMVVGFEIVKYSPGLSALGLQGEAERVGTISILGEIQIKDKETYGKEISEYVTHDLPDSYYSELRRVKDEEVYLEPEEHKELLDRFYKKWNKRHDEAKRRALERDFIPEDYSKEGPVSEFEIPIGKDIENIESPPHYNFEGDQGYLGQTENDLRFGRSYRGRYSDKGYGLEDKDYYEFYLDSQSSLKIKSDLVKLANHLDQKGFRGEADLLDRLLQKWAAKKDWFSEFAPYEDDFDSSSPKKIRGFLLDHGVMEEDILGSEEGHVVYKQRWKDAHGDEGFDLIPLKTLGEAYKAMGY
jgi:hypothetical protein